MRRYAPRLALSTALAVALLAPSSAFAFSIPAATARMATRVLPPEATEAAIPDSPGAATPDSDAPRVVRGDKWLYCVEFARSLSGIDIRGNAATWWNKAKGLYARLTTPEPGAVMVFASTRRMRAGHVAVVKDIVSNREVRVDHANWGNDGKIYLNAPVFDVSPKNDWSEVRVWNVKLGVLGSHTYRISGFVGT